MEKWRLFVIVRAVLLLVGGVMALAGMVNSLLDMAAWTPVFNVAHNFDLVAGGCMVMLGASLIPGAPPSGR